MWETVNVYMHVYIPRKMWDSKVMYNKGCIFKGEY